MISSSSSPSSSSVSRYLLALLSLATLALADSQAFKTQAAEKVEVSYSARDFTEMSVSYKPEDVLTSEGVAVLETRAGGDCWRRVPEKHRHRRAGRLVWRLAVLPCLQYTVRLVVEGEDCLEELSVGELGPASPDQISRAGYRPRPPGQARLQATEEGNVRLNFTGAPCAERYELFYESEDGESGSKNFSRGMTEDIIYNMKLNTSYSLSLTSYLAQEWSSVELAWPDSPWTTSDTTEEEEEECSQDKEICQPTPELMLRSGDKGSTEDFNSASSLLVIPLLSLTLPLVVLLSPGVSIV